MENSLDFSWHDSLEKMLGPDNTDVRQFHQVAHSSVSQDLVSNGNIHHSDHTSHSNLTIDNENDKQNIHPNDYMLFLNLATPSSTNGVETPTDKKSDLNDLNDMNNIHHIHQIQDIQDMNDMHNMNDIDNLSNIRQHQHPENHDNSKAIENMNSIIDPSQLYFMMQQGEHELSSSISKHSSQEKQEKQGRQEKQRPEQQEEEQIQQPLLVHRDSYSHSIPTTSARSRINSVEFTPLLSPMINPSLERVNSNKGKSGFSPLSSPVLEFQKYNNASTLRQKRKDNSNPNSNSDSLNDNNNNNNKKKYFDELSPSNDDSFEDSDNRSFKRSKTPVTTPLLQPLDKSRKDSIKNSNNSISPNLSSHNINSNSNLTSNPNPNPNPTSNSNSNSNANPTTPFQTFIFKQQQFVSNSNSNNSLNSTLKENSLSISNKSRLTSELTANSFLDDFDGELTLPPPPNSTNSDDFTIPVSVFNSKSNTAATPATLMSLNSTPTFYPKNKSISSNSSTTSSSIKSKKKNNVLLNPNHHKSAQSSPVILPSSSVSIDSPRLEFKIVNNALTSLNNNNSSNYSSSISTPIFKPNNNENSKNIGIGVGIGTNILGTSLSNNNNNNNPNSNPNSNITPKVSQSHHSDKKMSHKLAEQGRRNRMNIAIQELDRLVPESMKLDITVPSKATTVELGCRYIENLLAQIQQLQQLQNHSSNSDSISPLDAMDNK